MTILTNRRTLIVLGTSLSGLAVLGKPLARADEDVERILQMASVRMAALVSFHFDMKTIDGRSTILENLELRSVVGDVVRPDSFQATMTARIAVIDVSVEIVSIGGQVWITDPLQSGEVWRQIETGNEGGGDDASFTDLVNPDRLFLLAITYIDEPTIDGTEELNGEECTIISGTFVPQTLQDIASPIAGEAPDGAANLLSSEPVYLTAWIAPDGRVFRIEEAGPLTESESRDVVRQIDFSHFDGDIQIVEPSVS